ncbi:MAG TPA: type II secretion system F family protein [Desulfovibrio sp.]|jgi:tight adherence protein B|uniref:type II secretion system F family protein n=1 Tax=Desulfovibrio TaxID=872 RepID=UPI002A39807F|nr:type II secretion system F family protein [Desulfovibrio sp.]MDY0307088.1 type II secretion system F family protein [Desulfovibrionaceae bacterium]HMM39861.1 type II secretion system F family protein [Desulfovibrio sp.]
MIAALVGGGVTALVFIALAVAFFVSRAVSARGERQVRRRLTGISGGRVEARDVLRRETLSELPWFHRLLSRVDWSADLRRLLRQAGAPGTPGVYILAGLLCWVAGLYAVYLASGLLLLAVPAGLPLAFLPLFWLRHRRSGRMAAFQRQLPEALDLIARALRAGHTFEGGLRMVVDEFEDPIGPEFGQTLDEINFGADMDEALRALLARVDCPDLKFFVVSVNIQRETGGNLAEIIGNIAHLVRERFKLLGRVRVLSAEGRLSAMILLALPFGIALVINFLNPAYLADLFDKPLGRLLTAVALMSMGTGTLIIRRMIRIKV